MIKHKKLPGNIEDLIPKALIYLQSVQDILFAYLFGSFGRGKHFPLSDVDMKTSWKWYRMAFEAEIGNEESSGR
jgi:predicted nucleotidyltransferase